jgi:hypothetical protein
MIKIPNDLHQRSKSTQIQWAILFALQGFGFVYIITAGVAYIINQLGLTSIYDMGDIFWMAVIVFVFLLYNQYRTFKKNIMLLNKMSEVEQISKDIFDKIEKELNQKNPDNTMIRKPVIVEYLGKTTLVVVEFETNKDLSDEEKEKIFENIMDQHMDGLVLTANLKQE